jgi:hypothetical protein
MVSNLDYLITLTPPVLSDDDSSCFLMCFKDQIIFQKSWQKLGAGKLEIFMNGNLSLPSNAFTLKFT